MIPPCLTLSNIRYVSRIKWSNPGKGVVPAPTAQYSSYWKGSLQVALDYGCQLYLLIRSGLLAEISWSVHMSKSHRSLCLSFSRTAAGLCIYHLFVWSNFNFLHISRWITLPTQSCLVLYSFCANLLHSLIMWLMFLSLSPHNLHLLFWCILSILTLIWLVLMVLFCAANRRDSVFYYHYYYYYFTRWRVFHTSVSNWWC